LIRKATIPDVPVMHKLINYWAEQQRMLARALSELYENVRDFYIYEQDGEITGCGALHIAWSDLGEVKSLAVGPEYKGRGVGRAIVEECLKEAESLGLERVFALTYEPEFFCRCGFHQVSKDTLPHKIWAECIRCPKFPDCDEVAVSYDIKPADRQAGEG